MGNLYSTDKPQDPEQQPRQFHKPLPPRSPADPQAVTRHMYFTHATTTSLPWLHPAPPAYTGYTRPPSLYRCPSSYHTSGCHLAMNLVGPGPVVFCAGRVIKYEFWPGGHQKYEDELRCSGYSSWGPRDPHGQPELWGWSAEGVLRARKNIHPKRKMRWIGSGASLATAQRGGSAARGKGNQGVWSYGIPQRPFGGPSPVDSLSK